MPKVSGTQDSVSTSPRQVQSEVFDRKIKELLSMLTEVDARYEKDRAALDKWQGSKAVKAGLQQQLDARHRKDREPYVLELAEVHQRKMSLTLVRSVH